MRFSYYPDTDTLAIEFNPGPASDTFDVTANVLASLDAQGHIQGLTIEHASDQLDRDLDSVEPEILWQTAHSAALPAATPRFVYFRDTDTLAVEFTRGPAAEVADVTDSVWADINEDGSINGVTIHLASAQLGRDLSEGPPEIIWTVPEPLAV